ncbi:upstream activation factor subunit spp27 [Contarinia nasturtii]|uniref:upstream activation factor subunit spp27 n=1 Tax=Contarinia nasturtii TaxID=265458 RepID=UPI0012D4A55C|nr:upstream activation factor subunit spp27 [Contarinia nasturtii]
MAEISKETLRKEISAILKNADLEKTSSKKVRLSLENKFSCDFTNRRKEIDSMVMDCVDSMQNDEESHESSSEEEEKKKSPPKKVSKKRKADSDASSENNDSGDEYKPKKPAPKPKSKISKKADDGAKKKTTGRKGTGFTRPYQLSPQLAAVVGSDCLPRHEVVKRVWAIINERNLYDPKNKQFAICDSQLQTVMGVKRFRTFAMLKYLKTHFLG